MYEWNCEKRLRRAQAIHVNEWGLACRSRSQSIQPDGIIERKELLDFLILHSNCWLPLGYNFPPRREGSELENLETRVSVRFSSIRRLLCFPETLATTNDVLRALRLNLLSVTVRSLQHDIAMHSFHPFLLSTPVKKPSSSSMDKYTFEPSSKVLQMSSRTIETLSYESLRMR
ncbi:hypothetical protein E1B28_008062 [Marasmius oreades]|uniref:Uncharacterized protein n=1 Tax=Marasmius oreades TaxID=181124 RepID=A0A9P7S2X0_9AGAR|nr:uncharacterized protein E1B28_008062 [Marasmius oreades]KAG7094466.1 hypothetical protein E1B28_008062 [Marasmius oreades]